MEVVLIYGTKNSGKTAFARTFEEQGYHLYDDWVARIFQCFESNINPVKDVNTYLELYVRQPGLPNKLAVVMEIDDPVNENDNLSQMKAMVKGEWAKNADHIYRMRNGQAFKTR